MAVDVPRALVLIFLLLFLFLSPDTRTSTLSQQKEITESILNEKDALKVLDSSSYGDLDSARGSWLNLTGVRDNEHFAWHWLPKVQERARAQAATILDASVPLPKRTTNHSATLQYSPNSTTLNGHHFYLNASSIISGEWVRSKIGQVPILSPLNFTTLAPGYIYASRDFKRNITGLDGDLKVHLVEDSSNEFVSDSEFVREVKAEISIKDETSSGDGWEVVLYGVHFPQEGSMVFATTSEKFAGVFALPHFALSERAYSFAQSLFNRTLRTTIEKQEDSLDPVLNPWTSTPNSPSDNFFPTARCELIIYLQQHPLADLNDEIHDIEQELRFPTGLPLRSVPQMKFSALLFSPDCGFVLESKGPPDFPPQEGTHLVGPKVEFYITTAKRIVLCFAVLVSFQIYLIKRQMQDTSTPSTRSRVSLYSIVMMAMGDGFMFMCCLVAGMFIESLFLPLIAAGFVSFLGVSFFGMKFIMDIWTVQAPERLERERERQRRRDERNTEAETRNSNHPTPTHSSTAPNLRPSGQSASLPLPATARRVPNTTATPIILPPDQDIDATAAEDENTTNGATPVPTALTTARREMSAFYTKFYFCLLGLLLLSLHASSWPVPLRSAYCNILSFVYLSFWLPQIYRNVIRNCRKALRWEFVLGQSLLRFLPFAYFYLYKPNILFVKTDPHALYVLATWIWIQVWALISQEILGPRFFVKEGWAPPAFDYHPILREAEDGSEAGSLLPIGFSDSLRSSAPDPSPSSPPTSAGPSSPALARHPTNTSTRRSKTKKDSNGNHNSSNKRIFDCAICTEDLEVPVISSPSSSIAAPSTYAANNDPSNTRKGNTTASENVSEAAAMIFERRKYMVTPCRHIFHSVCLEGWMRYRLQCPICREHLPPL